jgi:hypothetical protein
MGGGSALAFSKSHDIAYHSFLYWLRVHRQTMARAAKPDFVELTLTLTLVRSIQQLLVLVHLAKIPHLHSSHLADSIKDTPLHSAAQMPSNANLDQV